MAPKGWLQSILELHLVVGDTRRGLRVGFEEMENGLAVASVIWWPVWPLGGLSQNEIGRARISMMARSDLLHAGPDTEAQDQSYHSADSACNARPVHTNGPTADLPFSFAQTPALENCRHGSPYQTGLTYRERPRETLSR